MSHPFQSDDDAFALGDAERLHLLRAKWPVFENEDGYAPGFDAFVVLLRHIYSFLPTGAPPEYGDESLEVLQVARKPIHDDNIGLVRVCKQSALSELVDDPKTDLGSLRFESLVKNPRVIEKLWSRHYYLLYSTTVLALAPSSQEWVVDEPYETRNVALESLFQWDGTRPLGESLSTLFGIFRHPATGWRYLRLPNMPITIRVLYDPNADELLNPPDFAQVRSFHITAKDCEPVDDEKTSFVLKETKCQYRLVASVDLETDTVRLYGINGAYIPPPHDYGELVSSRGSIGDLGRRYMLFFARTSDDVPPQVQNSLEVIEMPAFAPEEEGGFDLPPETNEQSDDDDGNDDENDGKTQPTKQPGFRIEDDGPTFTLGIIQQSAPALNLEDDALELALKTVPVPTASAMNQYSDDEDEVEDEEDEPEDTEMANVHPDRRPSTAVPPTHDIRRSDHRASRERSPSRPTPSHDNRRDDYRAPRERFPSWSPPRSSQRERSPFRPSHGPSQRRWVEGPRRPSPPPPDLQRVDRYRPTYGSRNSRPREVHDYRDEPRDNRGPRPSGGGYYDNDRPYNEYRDRGQPFDYNERPRRTPPTSERRRRSRSPTRGR